MLEAWAGTGVRNFTSDYRSLGEVSGHPWYVCADVKPCSEGPTSALHVVKGWMWCESDSTHLRVFRDHISAESFEQALQKTTPEDVWICSTNVLDAQVQTRLLAHHKANHQRLPVKIRFDPDEAIADRYRKQGQLVSRRGRRRTIRVLDQVNGPSL